MKEPGRGARATEIGARAEDAAVRHLLEAGMLILGRNVRVNRLEIDVVAREGPVVVVVEVRSRGRGAWMRPMDSIDWRKRARIRAAGESLWRTRFKGDPTLERMRFDIVSVTYDERGRPVVEHQRAAF